MAATERFLRHSMKSINIPCETTLFKWYVHKHFYIRLFLKLLVLSISPLLPVVASFLHLKVPWPCLHFFLLSIGVCLFSHPLEFILCPTLLLFFSLSILKKKFCSVSPVKNQAILIIEKENLCINLIISFKFTY